MTTAKLVSDKSDCLAALVELADFWKIPYDVGEEDLTNSVVVSTEPHVDEAKTRAVILCPVGPEEYRATAQSLGLEVNPKAASIRMPFTREVSTFLKTTLYGFSGSQLDSVIADAGNTILARLRGTKRYLLSVDLTSEYRKLLYGGLEDDPSRRFRLVTKLPLSYGMVPSFIRNRAFRSTPGAQLKFEEHLGPVECLRTIFLASIVLAGQRPVSRIGFWKRGVSHVLAVTHDVETREGLVVGAENLAKIEREIGVRSTWNVPSDRYLLSQDDLRKLAGEGEIGGHDTKHDGRLMLLSFNDKVKRLSDCRDRLESLSAGKVLGFRAPLLQHGRELLQALGKAGFLFDSSAPSWEALSPTSFRPHGVGTIFPFIVDGVLEIPVSLPQDHQLIRVAQMAPDKAVDSLLSLSKWVAGVGGVCLLLVHPDYEFAKPEFVEEYGRLLRAIAADPTCQVMTLRELAEWWVERGKVHLRVGPGGKVRVYGGSPELSEQLELQEVTDYSGQGFCVKALAQINEGAN